MLITYWLSCASSSAVSIAFGGRIDFNNWYVSLIHFCRTGSLQSFETGSG